MNEETVKKIREFNRFYTVWLEVMNKRYLGTILPWPEARVIFEIYMYPGISATQLCGHLQMDKSYVSRILGKFEKRGMLTRETVAGRKGLKKLMLTAAGEKTAGQIDANGSRQIVQKLAALDEETCQKLCEAMVFIESTLKNHQKERGTDDEQ